MYKILYILALAICCTSAIFIQEDSTNRISAGNIATDSQFPYAISLQAIISLPNQPQAHRCGGALITYQHALTAASCLYDTNNGTAVLINAAQYRVYAGGALLSGDTNFERIRTVANFTVHPSFLAFPALLNDIAVITLTTPYNASVVVPIPYALNDLVPEDFSLCNLAGWGASSYGSNVASNELRYATKYTYNHALCTSLFSTMPNTANIHPSMMCAASYDILSVGCYGDEGSALVCNGQLTGILSLTNGCITTSFPEVYTRVSNYTTWIRSVTGGASTFKPELGLFALLAIICAKILS